MSSATTFTVGRDADVAHAQEESRVVREVGVADRAGRDHETGLLHAALTLVEAEHGRIVRIEQRGLDGFLQVEAAVTHFGAEEPDVEIEVEARLVRGDANRDRVGAANEEVPSGDVDWGLAAREHAEAEAEAQRGIDRHHRRFRRVVRAGERQQLEAVGADPEIDRQVVADGEREADIEGDLRVGILGGVVDLAVDQGER